MYVSGKKYKNRFVFYVLICMIFILSGCSKSKSNNSSISNGNEIAVMPTVASDGDANQSDKKNDESSETGVIVGIDSVKMTVSIQSLDSLNKIIYNYNGATDVLDRYDKILTMTQLNIGEVVDFCYVNSSKKLKSVKASGSEWERVSITGFSINTDEKKIIVGSNTYKYTKNTVISNGNMPVDIKNLDSVDTLTLKGRDDQIDSIIVTSGHGYVKLDNTAFFEGGFVDIGSKIVNVITANMEIAVPIGNYTLSVAKDGTTGSKDIEVKENEEVRVSLTDFQADSVQKGSLLFKIEPSGAKLYVDGENTSYSDIVKLSYGNHKIKITMDGYGDYTETISVNELYKEYNITLVQSSETEGTSTEETTTTSETTTSNSSSSTKNTSTTTETTLSSSDWASIVSDLLQ